MTEMQDNADAESVVSVDEAGAADSAPLDTALSSTIAPLDSLADIAIENVVSIDDPDFHISHEPQAEEHQAANGADIEIAAVEPECVMEDETAPTRPECEEDEEVGGVEPEPGLGQPLPETPLSSVEPPQGVVVIHDVNLLEAEEDDKTDLLKES